ncbi:DNA gyrase subunit A [Desulfotomaculum arcticum]|uniref:DNA gyrase subunit A n=1 Tax=Desulfotruncus arcticus DSM 17038 TaxID=1121424 RepID=A0A1I2VNI6_9FIRM|nr:DNA gyrase subunit A [Desulfotruncus arcticus]SFG90643.1 DNA gyrase subunit A [Desulfotomaculum arcticum] [Desulfotruncus arcticus DSM 17038]
MPALTGKVVPIDIKDEMKHSYLDYAMSVIVGRALPDVRDGLKPVHRRILYAMHTLGVTPDKPHRKSAYIVGEVMAKYHPHGDAAIYDTLVRLAQDFSSRYPLVDGHGNFGSVDGDAAAAMRYTEARLSKIATLMLSDIEKETVDFAPNYDESGKEPVILPSRIPNLLVNGSAGIAVGMATNIPPHNLTEVIDGVVMLIDNPETEINDLMKVIKGPDFPSSAIIMGREGIRSAYKTGRGSIKVRAKAEIEETGKKSSIIVTELPYQVNKAKLVEKIAELVKDKKIEGITDLRDESDRHGMRIVIELRRDANPQVILNQLYKHTQMQDSFGVILLALVNGQPKVLNLKETLYHYLEHQKEIITRRTRYDLNKAEERAHIVEGLRIALANLDEVIKIIRGSRTVDQARKNLMERFNFSEKQAQAILDMRLHRLTGLEIDKLEAEYKDLIKKIDYLRSVLADEKMVLGIVKQEILEIKEKYGDSRRTAIADESIDFEDIDLIPEEDIVVTITNQGYIKRMPLETYRSQRRGGRGIHAMGIKDDDFLRHLFIATTHHYFLFFTTKGKVYRLKGYEIPEAGRQARGTAIVNLLYVDNDEYITTVIPIKEYSSSHYLFMLTRNGIVKKTSLNEYDTSRRDGIIALNLDEGDSLIDVLMTDNKEEIIIGTKLGMAIRFSENDVRPTGRASRGVKGITLKKDDVVVSMDRVREGSDLLVVTSQGYGKRTRLNEYRTQTRGGMGVTNIKCTPRNGYVVSLQVIAPDEEVLMISADGIMIRLKADNISLIGRATQGVLLMKLGDGDHLVAVARVVAAEDGGDE